MRAVHVRCWLSLFLLAGCGAEATCEPDPCLGTGRVCVVDADRDGTLCMCPIGSREVAGECVNIEACAPDVCGDNATCEETSDGPACVCAADRTGPRCEMCAEGLHDDGEGGCTDDLCLPDRCEETRRCVVEEGIAACVCPMGTHAEGDDCVPDTVCGEDSCGRGTCSDDGPSVRCDCDEGWTGAACTECDEMLGYHDDGEGECTTDVCRPNPCVEVGRTVCSEGTDGLATCGCDAGLHPEGEACVADESCTETTCGDRGSCSESGGVVSCLCDVGWTGGACTECASGYHDDGAGECTTDVCLPDPCAGEANTVCSVVSDAPTCVCAAGYHEDGGACVVDEACLPTTCTMHGMCTASGGVVACACEDGWAGRFCDVCDSASGYHADGAGGCTTDLCVPNPCVEANRSECRSDGSDVACDCDAGHHFEGESCVIDEVCLPDSCSMAGACSLVGGVVSCACEAGHLGDACEACDVDGGYHDDGAGDCTTDPCLPNPCTMPDRGVCTASGSNAVCGCDLGFHEDGVGGCTMDPCTPDPCSASGQACRVDGSGEAECYVPTCDDSNPCTDDSFEGGTCVFTPRGDGTACSTTLCITGQTCTGIVCGGGGATDCDDGNACTVDSCDDVTGCESTTDVNLVPDDGVGCTADSCATGFPEHVADDTRCDDAAWCTGVEMCAPSAPGADAAGCVVSDVPSAPGVDGPCGSWRCDEPSDRFVLDALGAGTSCNDGLACTTADQCDGSGACRGSVTATCGTSDPGDTCASTTAWPGGFDIPAARILGTITYGGGALPNSPIDKLALFYLRSQSTGALHRIDGIDFAWNGSEYAPTPLSDPAYDLVVDHPVLPGTYDIVYRRFYGSAEVGYGGRPDDPYPFGNHVLETDVVIGPGTNTLNFDIPVARITGAITYDGGALPNSPIDKLALFYLRSQSTGALHRIDGIDFAWNGSEYAPTPLSDPAYDLTVDHPILPGTYDIVYRRFYGSAEVGYGGRPDDPYPFGNHVLETDVVIGPGTNTLNFDIPVARITGAITYDGGALPNSPIDKLALFYLRSQSTGALHRIDGIDFAWNGSEYAPTPLSDPAYDLTVDHPILPGTYDVVYWRFYGSQEVGYGGRPDDPYPFGNQVLQTDVVIGPGANTLNFDIPAARITGAITYDGGALPNSPIDKLALFYLRSQSTGALHRIDGIDFGWNGSAYEPTALSDPAYDLTVDHPILPGTYDVVYWRFYGSQEVGYGGRPDDPYPFGNQVLQTDVAIGPGANTLNFDIPAARITGAITYDGGALPNSPIDKLALFYLRSHSTGALHRIDGIDFAWNGSAYEPTALSDPAYDLTVDHPILPGTYDVVYWRFYGSQEVGYGGRPDDLYPFGNHVVQSDVVIGPGANTLNLDIPAGRLLGALTYDEGALPNSPIDKLALFYLRSRSTGALHRIDGIDFAWNGTEYAPSALSDPAYDLTVNHPLLPGEYDVVYRRFYGSAEVGYGGRPNDPYPFGNQRMLQCVLVP